MLGNVPQHFCFQENLLPFSSPASCLFWEFSKYPVGQASCASRGSFIFLFAMNTAWNYESSIAFSFLQLLSLSALTKFRINKYPQDSESTNILRKVKGQRFSAHSGRTHSSLEFYLLFFFLITTTTCCSFYLYYYFVIVFYLGGIYVI